MFNDILEEIDPKMFSPQDPEGMKPVVKSYMQRLEKLKQARIMMHDKIKKVYLGMDQLVDFMEDVKIDTWRDHSKDNDEFGDDAVDILDDHEVESSISRAVSIMRSIESLDTQMRSSFGSTTEQDLIGSVEDDYDGN